MPWQITLEKTCITRVIVNLKVIVLHLEGSIDMQGHTSPDLHLKMHTRDRERLGYGLATKFNIDELHCSIQFAFQTDGLTRIAADQPSKKQQTVGYIMCLASKASNLSFNSTAFFFVLKSTLHFALPVANLIQCPISCPCSFPLHNTSMFLV
mgnify:FL=1